MTIIPEVNSFVPVQWLSPNPQFPVWLTQVKTCHGGSDFSQADLCNEYNSEYVSTVLSAPPRQETGLRNCNKSLLPSSSYQPTLECVFELLRIQIPYLHLSYLRVVAQDYKQIIVLLQVAMWQLTCHSWLCLL